MLNHRLMILLANSKSEEDTAKTGHFSISEENIDRLSCLGKVEHRNEIRIRQQYLNGVLPTMSHPEFLENL